eukprot:2531961-Amphidinium_carterae.2
MEQEPPFSLRSGQWQMRDCMWLLLASCDRDQPYQQRWKQSALDLQRLGFVTIELSGEKAREQLSEHGELPDDEFHVLVLISPDTYFPMSENDEEVSTLPRAVRRSNLHSLNIKLEGLETEKSEDMPDWVAPQNYPALDEELDDADDDEEPEVRTREPTEAELRSLQLAQNNLGHPINADFCRLLRRGGARAEVVRWTMRHFQCPACQQQQRPRPRLPAAAPQTFTLNALVGADLFDMVHPHTGIAEHWLHVVDWGTGFQQSERVQIKDAAHVFMVYARIWVRFFGHPSTLVVDAGREFMGQFSLACGHYGTLVH